MRQIPSTSDLPLNGGLHSYPGVFAYTAMHGERIRAHQKHEANGKSMEQAPAHDPRWLAVLVEEVGEVARHLCDYGQSGEESLLSGKMFDLRDELVQVGAMAAAWIDAINEVLDNRYGLL